MDSEKSRWQGWKYRGLVGAMMVESEHRDFGPNVSLKGPSGVRCSSATLPTFSGKLSSFASYPHGDRHPLPNRPLCTPATRRALRPPGSSGRGIIG